MSASVLYMSMSLDGFIAGPDDDVDNPFGTGGQRLHDWLGKGGDRVASLRPSGASGEVFDELMATGAVVVGRRFFELVGGWDGDHHGVPMFVLTRREPDEHAVARGSPYVTYVTNGVERAMSQAKQAAGDKDVLVHGAGIAQRLLAAGVLDELEIHLIPVLLGQGRRLFDRLGADHIELDLVRVIDAPGVTHLRFRIVR
jgi:dihydrofolate reductase